jgi:hypothetical protein
MALVAAVAGLAAAVEVRAGADKVVFPAEYVKDCRLHDD